MSRPGLRSGCLLPLRLTRAARVFPPRTDPCSNLSPLAYPGGDGVIDMELLSVIRRWHYRDRFSIREISRRGLPDRRLVGRLRPRPALGRPTLPDPQCDRRRHEGMPGRDRGHLDLWAARRPRTRRRRRRARQAGLDRLRPWNRGPLERNARLVAGAPDRLAFHPAGQADAERDLRSVQWQNARRTAQ